MDFEKMGRVLGGGGGRVGGVRGVGGVGRLMVILTGRSECLLRVELSKALMRKE